MGLVTRFEFATAARIVFGAGTVSHTEAIVREFKAARPLIVTGADPARARAVLTHVAGPVFSVSSEPTLEVVRAGGLAARGCDLVIAIGGGSVIDAGKAIAALATNPGDVLDYLEVIGKGKALTVAPLPFIAIPTTAGTGSEVTRNAVIGSPEHGVKASLRSAAMLAKVAIVDPELTRDLPPRLTASTGLDALTQLIEPYVSARANPLTDGLCIDGIRRVAVHLPRAFADGNDAEARENMALASLFGGLALANAGLGVVHGFAAPIGGMFEAPHGAVCAALLPHGIEVNLRALEERAPEHRSIARYREIERIVDVQSLCRKLQVPPLRTYGIGREHVGDLVQKASQASSMKANPIVLTQSELREVLESSI
jgi:alcohol dehydrogenase class IV